MSGSVRSKQDRVIARSNKKQAMIVSFSGIDGAGKSTQIANLRAHLQFSGIVVQQITFWDDVARLKRLREGVGHTIFKGDKGVGTPEAPIHRRDKNVRSPLMTLLRVVLYTVDALSLRSVANKALQSGNADVLIFDRYLYDELANLNLESGAIRLFVRFLLMLIPTPQVSFVLDADPAYAFARKPEYPLEFLYENRNAYIRLSQLISGITVIPPLPIEKAKGYVVRAVLLANQSFALPT